MPELVHSSVLDAMHVFRMRVTCRLSAATIYVPELKHSDMLERYMPVWMSVNISSSAAGLVDQPGSASLF
eukprot:scaffold41278_cov24-Tisochrysis_lutea.AAC.2